MARKFDGDDAWIAWIEKGIAALDRATSPKSERLFVRSQCCELRITLCGALSQIKSAGWEGRICKVLAEIGEIHFDRAKMAFPKPDSQHSRTLETWNKVLQALGDPAAVSTQARAMVEYSLRYIAAYRDSAKPLRDAHEQIGQAAALLRKRDRPEAAELFQLCERWRAVLEERFANDPAVILDLCKQMELAKKTAEALALLEKGRSHLTEYDYARTRGECLHLQGSMLLEQHHYSAAEPLLREAMKWRTDAAAQATDVTNAIQRRWETADSKTNLGQSVFRQGREEEGRQLKREAAETYATLAAEAQSPGRFRGAGMAWRYYADLLPAVEKLAARQKGLELLRQSVDEAKKNPEKLKTEIQSSLHEAAWTLLEIGDAYGATGNPEEKEAAYREGIRLSAEELADYRPADFSDNQWQLCRGRENLAKLLLSQNRTAEAREQVEQMGSELKQFEATPGAKPDKVTAIRKTVEDLRARLPAQ